MKRFTVILLSFVFCFIFFGCNADNTANKDNKEQNSSTAPTVTCTVTVECKSILSNMDDLKAGHEDYVPSDGDIINGYSVTLPEGSTAYDAVMSACEKQDISVNVSSGSFGKYIAGFNNIDEGDCGSQSGWTYTVNGESPSEACDRYTLSDGDSVDFSYICSYDN